MEKAKKWELSWAAEQGAIFKKQCDENSLNSVFLADEFKPNWKFWDAIETFTTAFMPAFIYGELVKLSYNSESFAIKSIGYPDNSGVIVGYIVEVTSEGLNFLDRVKGFNNVEGTNYHVRRLTHAYIGKNAIKTCWGYCLSDIFAKANLEVVENGFWDYKDEELTEFLRDLSV